MYSETLQNLGLSLNEAKIYETLLMYGKLSVSKISELTSIHRRNIYDSLKRLIERGLVIEILGQKDNLYQALDPYQLVDLLNEKQNQLIKVLPELTNLYQLNPPETAIYLYKGLNGFKKYLQDMLKQSTPVDFLASKGIWFEPEIRSYIKHSLKQGKNKQINHRHLFDSSIKQKIPTIVEIMGGQYKILPEKHSSFSCLDIFADKIVSYSGVSPDYKAEELLIYVTHNQVLAQSYRTWFNIIWDSLPEEKI